MLDLKEILDNPQVVKVVQDFKVVDMYCEASGIQGSVPIDEMKKPENEQLLLEILDKGLEKGRISAEDFGRTYKKIKQGDYTPDSMKSVVKELTLNQTVLIDGVFYDTRHETLTCGLEILQEKGNIPEEVMPLITELLANLIEVCHFPEDY